MTNRRFKSLRSRLRLLTWGIVLSLFLAESILVVFWFRNRYRREVSNRVDTAQAIGLTFRGFVRDILRQEAGMGAAIRTFAVADSQERLEGYLGSIARQYEAVRLFSLVDSTGRIFAGSNPRSIGKYVTERPYFERLMAGQEVLVSDFLRTRSENIPGFVIGRGFYNAAGRLEFAILAAVAVDELGEALDLPKVPGNYFTLFDSKGTLIHTDQPVEELTDSARGWRDDDHLLRKALEGEIATGFFTAPVERHRRRVGARVPIGETGWVAGDAMTSSDFLFPLLTVLGIVVLWSLAVAVAALLLAQRTIRSITRSLLGVQSHLLKVAEGNYATAQRETGLEEFDNLIAGTNRMAHRLEEREERLRASESSLKRAQEIAHLGSWELNLAENRLRWSDEVYRIFGLQPQEFDATYEAFLERIHPDDREAVDAAYTRSMQEGRESYEIEHRVVVAGTGRVRYVHEKCHHQRNLHGDVIRSVGMVHDITERKLAEEALRESEAKFRAVFEQAAVGIGRVSFDDAKWIDVNGAFCSMLGYTVEEFKSTPWPEITHSDDVDLDLIPFKQMAEGELDSYTVEKRFIHKQGHHVWARLTLSLVRDEQNRPDYEIAIIEDISERKQAEDALLRRTEELAAANRELETFSYSVSHDLRGPLNRIGSFAAVVLEDYAERLDEEGRGYLQRIEEGVQKMGGLIEDMLMLSRVSRQEMELVPMDLSAKVREYLDELLESDSGRQIEQAIQDGIIVRADPRLISLALENLLRNAWKFTSKNARARIEFGEFEHQGERVFVVRDNGAGFNMKYAERMFAPFQRLHAESEYSGTGIGLAIVQRAVARHGGRIWAEGKDGEGAAFYFTLGGM